MTPRDPALLPERAGPDAGWRRSAAFGRLDWLLAYVTEIPAAILVAVEILVLLAGVISRYVFNRPLTWSDELASILFLWLAMLGAVIALRRAEHMRLGFLVSLAPPRPARRDRDARHHGGARLRGRDHPAGASTMFRFSG